MNYDSLIMKIFIQYGSFTVHVGLPDGPPSETDALDVMEAHHLMEWSAGAFLIATGMQVGELTLNLTMLNEQPPLASLEENQELDEVTFRPNGTALVVIGFDMSEPVSEVLPHSATGLYRARLIATGRETDASDPS